MQRKIHGFPYISRNLTTLPLIITDSCFPTPRTRGAFCPTTLQFLSLLDSSDMTSDICMEIPVLTMEPLVGLEGPDPGLELS